MPSEHSWTASCMSLRFNTLWVYCLQAAKEAGEQVLVFGHLPLCPETCPPVCLLWNYDAVLKLLRRSGVVAATFAGHTHQNGFVCDKHGIHHIVLPGIVETPPSRDAYGMVDVYADALHLRGTDTMLSVGMRLAPPTGKSDVSARSATGRDPTPTAVH